MQPQTKPAACHARLIAGFVILSTFVIMMYGFIVYEAWVLHSIGGILVAVILIGILIALWHEAHTLKQAEPCHVSSAHRLLTFITLLGGAGAAYWISVHLCLGPVAGSALVGLLGALVFPRYNVPIYTGSFVGMSSAALLASPAELLLAAGIAGVVYILAEDALNGFGGKLGTIAFSGSLLAGLGLQRQFLISPVPSFELAWQIVALSVAAAVITYWLSTVLKHGPVLASSAVGVTGGLLLPAISPETGPLLAVVVICASFTGMSASKRFASPLPMIAAGLLTGIVFLYSVPVFGGTGGKLGTIAFGASLAVWGYQKAFRRMR
ncbi:MAG: hypothetical protein RBT34_04860 [Anaerolineaceae bacterium]|jgi:hypothetical protein|nr:hypothetical protein [Anaerolineaceae bacterium]